jgi:hypothetical protein
MKASRRAPATALTVVLAACIGLAGCAKDSRTTGSVGRGAPAVAKMNVEQLDLQVRKLSAAYERKPKEKKITDSKPDSAPGCSDNFSKELEDRLAKNITKQLRDDMLSQRALTDVRPSSAPCMADTMPSTNLTQQGYEYQNSKPLDMNDYIRKDSIPCWGCSLPQ